MQNTEENIRELKDVVRRETPRLLRLPGVKNVSVALKMRDGLPTNTLCVRVTIKEIIVKEEMPAQNANDQTEQPDGAASNDAPGTASGASQTNRAEILARKKEQALQKIKSEVRLSGYPVDVIEIKDTVGPGETRVCDVPTSEARTGTYDELKGGIPIYTEQNGVRQPYGTLGMVVYDRRSCQPVILTSRDILGGLSLKQTGQEEHEEKLFQGDASEPVGERFRSDFQTIKTKDDFTLKSNFLVAAPTGGREVSPDVEGIEFERIFLEPRLGMKVWKSGARTGVTEGIITQISGYDIRVGSQSEQPFACEGDTGAIIFGQKGNTKRPVGIVTKFSDELDEVRCVSLRPVLLNNPWLDISLAEEIYTKIHRFWNPVTKTSLYSSLDDSMLKELDINYQYQDAIFEVTSMFDIYSEPLLGWYNPQVNTHYYYGEKSVEQHNLDGKCYSGQVGFVSKKSDGQLHQIHYVVDPQTNDQMMVLAHQLTDAINSGYQTDNSVAARVIASPTLVTGPGNNIKPKKPNKVFVRKPNQKLPGFVNNNPVIFDLTGYRADLPPSVKQAIAKEHINDYYQGNPIFKKNGAFWNENAEKMFHRSHGLSFHKNNRIVNWILHFQNTLIGQYEVLNMLKAKPLSYHPDDIVLGAKKLVRKMANNSGNIRLNYALVNLHHGPGYADYLNDNIDPIFLIRDQVNFLGLERRSQLIRKPGGLNKLDIFPTYDSRKPIGTPVQIGDIFGARHNNPLKIGRLFRIFSGLVGAGEAAGQIGQFINNYKISTLMDENSKEVKKMNHSNLNFWWSYVVRSNLELTPGEEYNKLEKINISDFKRAYELVKNASTPEEFFKSTSFPYRYEVGEWDVYLSIDFKTINGILYLLYYACPEDQQGIKQFKLEIKSGLWGWMDLYQKLNAGLREKVERLKKEGSNNLKTVNDIRLYNFLTPDRLQHQFDINTKEKVQHFEILIPKHTLNIKEGGKIVEKEFELVAPLSMEVWEYTHEYRCRKIRLSLNNEGWEYGDTVLGGSGLVANPLGAIYMKLKWE
ncbi:MAG: hypothetical protein ABUK01_05900 [Leptospirales bacterium]